MSGGRLSGMATVVTGAASGIGAAAAELFAAEGAQVVVADRDVESGRTVAKTIVAAGHDARFVPTDVADPSQVEAMIAASLDAWGKIDVLFSNAGAQFEGTALETTHAEFMRALEVNLASHFSVARHGIPALAAAGGGSLIFTASELGLVGTAHTVSYCTAKAGVINMTRALAIDCAPMGIRVNCIAPGPVDTPMLAGWLTGDPQRLAAQLKPILLGRLGTPQEIARGALFLASSDSSFMTGAQLVLDGGATCWYGL
jgi:meso-butanediol dehydrogenase / (S,S)-butanediol dehydrogenase / diacetyl reductase